MKHRKIILMMVFWLLFLFSTLQLVQAQSSETCPALARDAIAQLATNCANTGNNAACYGNDQVSTTFAGSAGVFSSPGDRVDLTTVQAVQTGHLDLANQEWGLSLMNVQANIPTALGGVVYALLGGVEVENGVEPGDALQTLAQGIPSVSAATADLRTYPAGLGFIDSEVIGTIPSGASLSIDARTENGEWVRVVYQRTAGWIPAAVLRDTANLNDLPVITPGDRTPMQEFFFRVGIGGVPCADAPSLLVVQGPPGVPVDIRLHETNIRIESTIVLRTLPPGDQLGDFVELITLFGMATINPGTPNAILVPPGFSSRISLGEFVSLGIEGDEDEKRPVGNWSSPRALTREELQGLLILTSLPGNILHYTIEIPSMIQPSGEGQPRARLVFRNPQALAAARIACERGLLSADICQYLGLSSETCPALARDAITQLTASCADAENNEACYGNTTVNATFAGPAGVFSSPGDRVDLTTVQAVQTGLLNLAAREWGLSLMNVQANLPNALGGAAYVLLGGVEVENDVEPGDALQLLAEGIASVAASDAELRTYPAELGFIDSEVIGTIPAGASLSVDARSENGEWVRVAYQGKSGWILVSALESAESLNLDDLPIITPDDRTPMQSFYFRVGTESCVDAPSLLIIQGPPGVPVDIRVHDTTIRIESTIVLRTLPPGAQLGNEVELITLFGMATINPGTSEAILVPPGFSSQVSLGDLDSLGIEGDSDEKHLVGDWSDSRALTQEELQGLGILTSLPDNILHYPIEIPFIIQSSDAARLVFNNPQALATAQRDCERGLLPEDVCQYLGW